MNRCCVVYTAAGLVPTAAELFPTSAELFPTSAGLVPTAAEMKARSQMGEILYSSKQFHASTDIALLSCTGKEETVSVVIHMHAQIRWQMSWCSQSYYYIFEPLRYR